MNEEFGINTSEFKATVGGVILNVIAIMVIMGLIPKSDQENITAALMAVLSGGLMVFANGWVVVNYIKAMVATKSEQLRSERFAVYSTVEQSTKIFAETGLLQAESGLGGPMKLTAPGSSVGTSLRTIWPVAKTVLQSLLVFAVFVPWGGRAKTIIEALIVAIDNLLATNPNIQ